MSQGFYELLGVSPDAKDADVRAAYQLRLAQLVRRLRLARKQGADVTILEAQERQLREAREVLGDGPSRRRYDAYRAAVDDELPTDAATLWESTQSSLVEPELSLALAVVRALTRLPVGHPIPDPPTPVRVERAVLPSPASPAHDSEPDRPTLVPATDPGIEISLSDADLAWLDEPSESEAPPRVAPPMVVEVDDDSAWTHDSASSDTWAEPEPLAAELESDDDSDWSLGPVIGPDSLDVDDHADDFSDLGPLPPRADGQVEDAYFAERPSAYDERPTEVPPSQPVTERALDFLSRLTRPRAPRSTAPEPMGRPASSSPPMRVVPDDPIQAALHEHGPTGPFLRAVRESHGLSLADLSRTTRISTRYLEAIETDAFDKLPSATFVKGYIKQVVEQLGLVEHGVVEAFMAAYRSRRG